ncbi:c-type cytochrome [Larkinella arboricola]|uniref:Mono/diheme cytochrome c family protein n=1 Tax=Larkinella arboricola TaxID=643671 RepID=A0A327WSQ7_LARAB|nr:cytochrome c [Larkinella arboricola]RAJ95712.1 mono/diheme cytochrome c family protein [Larkinella arboricola]
MRIVFALGLCLLTLTGSAQTKKPASKSAPGPGQQIYEQYCLTCHQVDGSGVPNLNPPLKQTDWVQGDKTRLINVILKGLQEPIEINGETFDNVMPAHDFLSDKEIADVLTFVRSNFGNKADAITAEEVKKVRAGK